MSRWYACRWGIEVWHRILKSGCRIEARQLATAERLQRCLTLYSVIAWRVFYATMLARAVPEIPCSVLLEIEEWQALYCAIHQCPTPPDQPPSLGAGRALDCTARRFCGAPPPRPTRARDVVAWLSTFNGPHKNVSYYAFSPALNEKMCPSGSLLVRVFRHLDDAAWGPLDRRAFRRRHVRVTNVRGGIFGRHPVISYDNPAWAVRSSVVYRPMSSNTWSTW